MATGVLLLAAGAGRRFGGSRPKQFLKFKGEPLFFRSLRVFLSVRSVSKVILVVPPSRMVSLHRKIQKAGLFPRVSVAAGGRYRGESVKNGLQAFPTVPEVVLVHDAARPLVDVDVIRRVEAAAKTHGAALAAWPLADTLKKARAGDFVESTVDRNGFWLAQTPQGFRRDVALRVLNHPSLHATDDAALAQAKGHRVKLVKGSRANFKVTVRNDLKLAESLAQGEAASVRTGFGFDSHLFDRSGVLVLGGRRFPGLPALKGHSDGDALLHALMDAFLGAAAAGDIGRLFPDTKKSIKGISSRVMMRKVMAILRARSFKPLHIDLTVMAMKPRITPVEIALRRAVGKLIGLSAAKISLKAKTPEGLNLFKSPGGIAVWAVATVGRVSAGSAAVPRGKGFA